MSGRKTVLAVSDVYVPGRWFTGGVFRSTRSLREYSKHYDVYLIVPRINVGLTEQVKQQLIRDIGLTGVLDYAVRFTYAGIFHERYPNLLYIALPDFARNIVVKYERPPRTPDAVVVLNEPVWHVALGKRLKEEYGVRSMVLFQLPPFYADKQRRELILMAFLQWFRELYGDEVVESLAREFFAVLESRASHSRSVRKLYESHDILVAVSKSIPLEMGEEWVSRFRVLDPGVVLDREDLELIAKVKERVRERSDTVIFGGRPSPEKGFIEGLVAFKVIGKRYSSLKLVVTGHIGEKLRWRIERLVKRLGLEGRVHLAGAVLREERFRLVAEARFVLYPSHVDAYPYAVLEALHLGTPLVAYNIPALKLNFGGNPCVRLVREGDLEALVEEAMDVLDSKEPPAVEPPRTRNWEDIMKEELKILQELFEKR